MPVWRVQNSRHWWRRAPRVTWLVAGGEPEQVCLTAHLTLRLLSVCLAIPFSSRLNGWRTARNEKTRFATDELSCIGYMNTSTLIGDPASWEYERCVGCPDTWNSLLTLLLHVTFEKQGEQKKSKECCTLAPNLVCWIMYFDDERSCWVSTNGRP